jgi:GPH family glycoside/pentoside/hexuronide:cation symporter
MAGAFALFMAKPGIGPVYLWFWLMVVYAGYSMGRAVAHRLGRRSVDRLPAALADLWLVAGRQCGRHDPGPDPAADHDPGVFKGDHAAGIRAMGWFIVLLIPFTVLLATRVRRRARRRRSRHASGLRQYLRCSSALGPEAADRRPADGPGAGIAGALFFFFFERIKHFDKTQAGFCC